jgi:hypothetical protein
MPCGMGVFAGMTIRRAVAAECYPALLAGSQMNPVCADFNALFAFLTLRMFYRPNRFEMRAR